MTVGKLFKGFVLPAVLAAAGLWALVLLGQWVAAMFAAGMRASDLPFALVGILALPAAIALTGAVPLLRRWQPRPRIAILLASVCGLAGLLGAAITILTGPLLACLDLCQPVDTWLALPSIIVAGLLAATGPGLYALARDPYRLGDLPDSRNQVWWGLAAAFCFLGLMAGLLYWVEVWLYPS